MSQPDYNQQNQPDYNNPPPPDYNQQQNQQYNYAPPPPGGNYGPPGGGYTEPHRGTMILIFGILGLVCCIIFGILAWVFGNQDLQKMDAGQMDPSGRGLTQAGRIMGIVSVCLAIVGIIIQVALLATGIHPSMQGM